MENNKVDTLLFGLSQKVITPKKAISLAGLGPRISQGVLDDLYVRVACLEKNEIRLIIISFDLLWVSRSFVDKIRTWIWEVFCIPPENILICATHTHSGPQTRENSFDGSSLDPEYVEFLERRVQKAVVEACSFLERGVMQISVGSTSHTVNRRRAIFDYSEMKRFRLKKNFANRPNPHGARDKTVTAIFLRSLDGDTRAIFFNLACHASLYRGRYVSKDLPGCIERALEKSFGKRCAFFFFLQGFTGNVRAGITRSWPSPVKVWNVPGYLYSLFFDRHQFVNPTNQEEADRFARRITDDFLNTMQSRPLALNFSCTEKEIFLPLQDQHQPVPFRVQRMSLAKDCFLVAMEGEIFAEYALFIREIYSGMGVDVLPVGCAGGMVGYIPTADALIQGGYEPERSLEIFGLPAKFSFEIEGMIKKVITTTT